jgi:hypothetical protein
LRAAPVNDNNGDRKVHDDGNDAEAAEAHADRVDAALEALWKGDPSPLDQIAAEDPPPTGGDDAGSE